jgi:putative sigma-54 modulation protein
MQINLTGHHVDLTQALRDYVNDKFERLERHFDNVIDVHVILTVEKLQQKAEATMQVSGNNLFADAIRRTCTPPSTPWWTSWTARWKHKEKLKDHHRAEGSHRNHGE